MKIAFSYSAPMRPKEPPPLLWHTNTPPPKKKKIGVGTVIRLSELLPCLPGRVGGGR
jgi:hypothetical protein